jgi:hypothetical protein
MLQKVCFVIYCEFSQAKKAPTPEFWNAGFLFSKKTANICNSLDLELAANRTLA